MIATRPVPDCLRDAFTPTPPGVAGLADQLLGACAGGEVVFERVGDRCVYRWAVEGDTQEGTAPIRPAAFRAVVARVAALCYESRPGSVTPYRGEGLLPAPGQASELVRVRFVNTPERQYLALSSPKPAVAVGEQTPDPSRS